jgi:hypothetical protein
MVVLAQTDNPVDAGRIGWFGIECGLALCWLLAAAVANTTAGGERTVSYTYMSACLLLLATAEGLRALTALGHSEAQFFATGLQLLAGVLVLVNAVADLMGDVAAESARTLVLSRTVQDAERLLTRDERNERARRHDARSVLAALRTASMVLDRYDETLDRAERAQLLGSFTHELAHLESVIETRSDAGADEFPVTAIVEALGNDRVVIEGDLPSTHVRGHATELSALVASTVDLLRRGAPDTAVGVRVSRSTSGVQIRCTSRHEQRPADDDTSALNLRLQLAKRVLREQGGDIASSTRWDGTVSVVFWLQCGRQAAPAVTPPDTASTAAATAEALAVPQQVGVRRQRSSARRPRPAESTT